MTRRAAGFVALALCSPAIAFAYSQGGYYGEGGYYSQSTYYSQASYSLTFTNDIVTAKQDFSVTGNVAKGAGTFLIDHPLDPKNSLLYHSFVESPDAKNLYDGVATLDTNGEAVVELPDYFEALNKDFRYQLKPIGKPMPNLHVRKEIAGNRFTIGGEPGGRVSWQVTGNRRDPFIEANPIRVEVEKGPNELVARGQFFFDGYEKNARFPTNRLVAFMRDLFSRQ